MSALRMSTPGAPVRHVDPHTRQDYRPVLLSWCEAAPVTVVRAASIEARCPSARKPRTEITLPRNVRARGLYLAHLSDADVLVAVTGRSQSDAAALLRCSQSSIARRLRQIRAGVTA